MSFFVIQFKVLGHTWEMTVQGSFYGNHLAQNVMKLILFHINLLLVVTILLFARYNLVLNLELTSVD